MAGGPDPQSPRHWQGLVGNPDPEAWNVAEVKTFLSEIGLKEAAVKAETEGVDGTCACSRMKLCLIESSSLLPCHDGPRQMVRMVGWHV